MQITLTLFKAKVTPGACIMAELLLEHGGPIKKERLAAMMNVTPKTISNYFVALKAYFVDHTPQSDSEKELSHILTDLAFLYNGSDENAEESFQTAEQEIAQAAAEHGLDFIVVPELVKVCVEAAKKVGYTLLPGVATRAIERTLEARENGEIDTTVFRFLFGTVKNMLREAVVDTILPVIRTSHAPKQPTKQRRRQTYGTIDTSKEEWGWEV